MRLLDLDELDAGDAVHAVIDTWNWKVGKPDTLGINCEFSKIARHCDDSGNVFSLTVGVTKQEKKEIDALKELDEDMPLSKAFNLVDEEDFPALFDDMFSCIYTDNHLAIQQQYFAIIWLNIAKVKVDKEPKYYIKFPFGNATYFLTQTGFDLVPSKTDAGIFTQKMINAIRSYPSFVNYNLDSLKVRKED